MLPRKILSDVLKIDYLIVSNIFNGHSIKDLWYADIKHYALRNTLLMAVVHTEQAKMGVLWFADARLQPVEVLWDKIEIPSGKSIVLDLSDWDDPVIPTLHDMDIAPREREMPACVLGGFDHYSFRIETDFFEAAISSISGKRNPKLSKLVGALSDTLYFFVDKA